LTIAARHAAIHDRGDRRNDESLRSALWMVAHARGDHGSGHRERFVWLLRPSGTLVEERFRLGREDRAAVHRSLGHESRV